MTMIDKVLNLVAPHHCYGCGTVGDTLCESCKNYMIFEPFEACLLCLRPSLHGLCSDCHASYTKAWCVGSLDGNLKNIIYDYKFKNLKSASDNLVDLLDSSLPYVPSGVVVTYLPTVPAHIRQRGYDHARLIAKSFAKKRNLRFQNTLYRTSYSQQHGSSAKTRWKQAAMAYGSIDKVEKDATYLLIDDIMTTGASLEHASRKLLKAGAKEVWVAVLARQTLD